MTARIARADAAISQILHAGLIHLAAESASLISSEVHERARPLAPVPARVSAAGERFPAL